MAVVRTVGMQEQRTHSIGPVKECFNGQRLNEGRESHNNNYRDIARNMAMAIFSYVLLCLNEVYV